MSDGPLLIIADNYAQADQYARRHDLGPEKYGWQYINHMSQVLGRAYGRYVRITRGFCTVREINEREAIEAHLVQHGFTEVTE